MITQRQFIVCVVLFALALSVFNAGRSGHDGVAHVLSAQGDASEDTIHLPLVVNTFIRGELAPPEREKVDYNTPFNVVHSIAYDEVGDRIVAATDGGVIAWDPDTRRHELLRSGQAEAVEVDADGGILTIVVEEGGRSVWRLDPRSGWKAINPPGTERFNPDVIEVTEDGAIWMGEDGHFPFDFWRLETDDTWTLLTDGEWLTGDPISVMASDREGGVWASHSTSSASKHVLSHIHADGRIDRYGPETFSDDIMEMLGWGTRVAVGPDGAVWAGDDMALVHRDADGEWTEHSYFYAQPGGEPLYYDEIQGIALDRDGGVWIGEWLGLLRIEPDGTAMRIPDREDEEAYFAAMPELWRVLGEPRDLLVGPDSSLWVASTEGGIGRMDLDGKWTLYLVRADDEPVVSSSASWEYFTPINEILALAFDHVTERVISATEGGLVAWDPGTGLFERLSFFRSEAVAVDADGRIWAGGSPDGSRGASRLSHDGTWTTFLPSGPLAERFYVGAIVAAEDGTVWFGEKGWNPIKVWRLSPDGEWNVFTPDDGLVNGSVFGMTPDGSGGVWVAHFGFFDDEGSLSHIASDGTVERFGIETFGESVRGAMDVAVDGLGRVWMATGGDGVAVRDLDGEWTVYDYDYDGHYVYSANSIAVDDDGGIWLNDEVSLIHIGLDGSARTVPSRDELRSLHSTRPELAEVLFLSTALVALPGGGVAVGNRDSGLAVHDADEAWTVLVDAEDGVPRAVDEIAHHGSTSWLVGAGSLYGRHERRGWHREQGAPGSMTRPIGMVVDDSGRLWAANGRPEPGASLWYRDPDGSSGWLGLPEPHDGVLVRSIAPDGEGGLWFTLSKSTDGASPLLWRSAEGEWESRELPEPLAASTVMAVAAGPGVVWVATSKGLGKLVMDGEWSIWSSLPGIGTTLARDVAIDAAGSVWVTWRGWGGSTIGGVGRLDPDSTWHVATVSDGLADSYVTAVAPDDEGGAWFATRLGMSHWRADGTWRTIGEIGGLDCHDAHDVMAANDGAVWFDCGPSMSGDVHRLDPDGTITSRSLGFPQSYSLYALAADTDSGAFVLDSFGYLHSFRRSISEEPSTWVTHRYLAGPVVDVLADSDGGLWAASSGGISYRSLADGRWRTASSGDGLPASATSAVAITPDGTVWAGMASVFDNMTRTAHGGGLARRIDEHRWEPVPGVEDGVRAMVEDSDGGLWLATERHTGDPSTDGTGLRYRAPDGTVRTFRMGPTAADLPTDEIRDIILSPEGMVFLATDAGIVTRAADDEWMTMDEDDGLPSLDVWDLDIDARNRMWAATSAGAVRLFGPDGPEITTTEEGLSSNDVRAVSVDAFGRVWFGTDGAGTSVLLSSE